MKVSINYFLILTDILLAYSIVHRKTICELSDCKSLLLQSVKQTKYGFVYLFNPR